MSGVTFEQIRFPLAVILVAMAIAVLWPRGGEETLQSTAPSPSGGIVVGVPGGEIVSAPTPTAAPATPAATAAATPAPTPVPTAEPPDTFAAEVLACRAISGSRCRGEFERFPPRGNEFTALVLFTDARAGDTINVALTGPGIEITGGPFTLDGGGDGYYYSNIALDDLPEGDYVLAAFRNGSEVARITLRRS